MSRCHHILTHPIYTLTLSTSHALTLLGLQVKILREEEGGKVGPDGKPRSKGMGFLEFRCVGVCPVCAWVGVQFVRGWVCLF